ncbi:MAG: deoxynucleoside kinase [Saprospiraceae bacterium]|nr:deoxynucleoside kinase [Saprospiraceae bacterium]
MQIPNGNYIVIEGNIGAGKTSFAQLLSKELDARLILEEFSDNPFLPLFYKNPERYAFPVELFFMTERHKQLQELLLEQDLFQQYTVSDYVFSKTLLFAKENLEGEEFRLFQRLFMTLNASFPRPDLLVYLHRPVQDLLSNIRLRNRSYEQTIPADYLQKIQDAYFNFFRTKKEELPILILDSTDIDFIHNPNHYQLLLEQLQKSYPTGIHHCTLRELIS